MVNNVNDYRRSVYPKMKCMSRMYAKHSYIYFAWFLSCHSPVEINKGPMPQGGRGHMTIVDEDHYDHCCSSI